MTSLHALELFVLSYFCLVCLGQGVSLLVAARKLAQVVLRDNSTRFNDLLRQNHHKPISILVPAYNEEATIVSNVSNLIGLHYPTFEVIVVDDGSSDRSLEELREAFALKPVEAQPLRAVSHKEILGTYRSRKHPNLLVVHKLNGGKADALNAGLNQAQYPLFCAVDADSLLDADALLRASLCFMERPELVALGGIVRVLNSCEVVNGNLEQVRAPQGWLERFQVIEYARAFLAGRSTFSSLGILLIISGAFGLFRRESVVEAGGYRSDTVGEDMEMVVRLHRYNREAGREYRIEYSTDPICWTQVPSHWSSLKGQRDRWQRGLLESLWIHRSMLFNPRYGRLGLAAVPYFWLIEALSPLIEVTGYVLALLFAFTGHVSVEFAAALLVLSVGYGTLVNIGSLGLEIFMRDEYDRLGDRLSLLAASVLENVGIRQALAVVRAAAMVTVFIKRSSWGAIERTGMESSTSSAKKNRDGGTERTTGKT